MLHNYLENAHKFIFCYLLFCCFFLFSFHTPPHVSVCVCVHINAYICIIHMHIYTPKRRIQELGRGRVGTCCGRAGILGSRTIRSPRYSPEERGLVVVEVGHKICF